MHDTLKKRATRKPRVAKPVSDQTKLQRVNQSYRYWRHIRVCVLRAISKKCKEFIWNPIELSVMYTQHMIWCQLRDDNESGV